MKYYIWHMWIAIQRRGLKRIEMEKESAGNRGKLTAEELEERLIDFAVRIIKLVANLPKIPQ